MISQLNAANRSPATDYDVVIVGGGPAGASAAIHLAQAGGRVLVLEKDRFPRHKLCGEFISPECLGEFARLGVLLEMTASGGVALHETVFYDSHGRGVAVPSAWFGAAQRDALGLSRARMDEVLLARARAVGAEVWEAAQVVGAVQDTPEQVNGVRVRVKGAATQEVRARVTLDASGRGRVLARRVAVNHRSVVSGQWSASSRQQVADSGQPAAGSRQQENSRQHAAGSRQQVADSGQRAASSRQPEQSNQWAVASGPQENSRQQEQSNQWAVASGPQEKGRQWAAGSNSQLVIRNPQSTIRNPLVAFKAHLAQTAGAAGKCEIYFYRGGYGGLNGVEGGAGNLCFIVSAEDAKRCNGDAMQLMKTVVMANPRAAKTLRDAVPVTGWSAVALERFGHFAVAPCEGLLTAGDAAAFIDPFTGSGMLMALQCGALAAAAISQHLPHLAANDSNAWARLAADYAARHNAQFAARLRVCSWLRRAAFAPRLADVALRVAGLSDTLRRRLARATRHQ